MTNHATSVWIDYVIGGNRTIPPWTIIPHANCPPDNPPWTIAPYANWPPDNYPSDNCPVDNFFLDKYRCLPPIELSDTLKLSSKQTNLQTVAADGCYYYCCYCYCYCYCYYYYYHYYYYYYYYYYLN